MFTTLEAPDLSGSIMYEAEDGHLYPFDRDKLFISLYESLKHRSSAISDTAALSLLIIGNLLKSRSGVISRHTLVITTAEALKRFDSAAHTAYNAYHPETRLS